MNASHKICIRAFRLRLSGIYQHAYVDTKKPVSTPVS